jgi:hypothetical protein
VGALMGWRHVHIMGGELAAATFGDEPPLWFSLMDDRGDPIPKSYEYRGDAMFTDDGREFGISRGPWDTQPLYFKIGQPTKDSIAYLAGWKHADKQKRKVWPKRANDDEQFKYGWMERWKEKRPRKNPSCVDGWWAR